VIPNVVKGSGMVGLMRYLVGPGRANEHSDPHLVAGSDMLLAGYGQEVLSRQEGTEIAAWIDSPRRIHGTVITVPVYDTDPDTGDRVATGERKEQHVFHCSLSLAPGERLDDGRWQAIAGEFATAMGFDGSDGRAPCRWAAVHHGASKDGNDHVHFVASMVREDGRRWGGTHRDFAQAQKACRALEVRHGLTVVEGPERGISERGVKPAEARRAQAAGVDPEVSGPRELAARVRAAGEASRSEAEFVRRVRAEGIVIKPRYAKDSTSEVVGYKVAERPPAGSSEWEFLSGGKLGRDLTLPELRERWGQPRADTPAEAVAEWRAAHGGHGVAERAGRETRELAAGAERVAVERWQAFNERLAALPHTDTAGWAEASRQTAAALAAWGRTNRDPDAARAARVLARATGRGTKGPGPGPAAATVLLARTGRGSDASRALGAELNRSVELIGAHHAAVGDRVQAERIGARPGLSLAAPARAAGRIAAAVRGAERIVDHGR
jgi:hypothetical protein